jgi:hypothetical protein
VAHAQAVFALLNNGAANPVSANQLNAAALHAATGFVDTANSDETIDGFMAGHYHGLGICGQIAQG